ncbi:spore germination protein GerPC [Bacillus massiliigorillae]|uniref:spore germination protein GerPC n=1 Tax=Bacillus massiliigorillae TaxID=1243664 RepID=UPI0003AAC28E|nr:spore germination protein GerPC [Bacillus massiliigorillae]
MNNEFYTYAAEMKAYLETQAKRIAILEAEITSLKEKLKQMGDQSPVNIERIEYKFDQLKIERLDGTLNIGLNPANLSELEDFAVNGQSYPVPFPPHLREQISQEITTYIEKELPSIISSVEAEMAFNSQGEYETFIKDDLAKQLPDRIQYYINQHPYTEQNSRNNSYQQKIIEQIKTDITQAVRAFFTNVRNSMKGM